MAIDRRQLILALLAGAAAARPALGEARQHFVSCRTAASGDASLCVFDMAGDELFSTPIPARGHDIAARPGARDLVAFARRPGTWFVVVDARTGEVTATVVARQGRHFYGHGVFSADGKILYATENDIASGNGVIGLYDATNRYARAGEFPSGGIGPHDIALAPDGTALLIANGGLRTHPESGRETLNPGDMKPNLAVIDCRHGAVTFRAELGAALRQLSIRHLALAQDGSAVFGCQHQGEADDQPPLVGVLGRHGDVSFLAAPEDVLQRMDNYVGSVGFDGSGDYIAATGPHGGQIMIWRKVCGAFVGVQAMSDVCGVAALGAGRFAASSGNAGIRDIAADGHAGAAAEPLLLNWIWDNHLRRLTSA